MIVIPPDNKNVMYDEDDQHRTRGYGYGHDDLYRPAERIKDAVATSLSQVLEDLGAGVVATEKIGAANQLATEKIGAATQLATERTAAAVASANAANFTNTQNLLISGFKDGRFDAATLTASILQGQVVGFKDGRYDAAVNQAAIQAALAECCCELKMAVSAEGGKTRELMNAIDARRSDRELVDSKNEVALLKLQLATAKH